MAPAQHSTTYDFSIKPSYIMAHVAVASKAVAGVIVAVAVYFQ